jgi:hypothetical protein
MKQLIVITLFMLVPQLATAGVYMCVDEATGETSFTDKACETASTREEVRVDPVNLNSGHRYTRRPKTKTWRSQSDTRKSGADFNAQRRGVYESKASASTN